MKTNSLVSLVLLLAAPEVSAFRVDFNDTDRAPNGMLQIGDVTVMGGDVLMPAWSNGSPATVLGIGLGSATQGPVGSVDSQFTIPAGQIPPSNGAFEGLSLFVDGAIDSITILPYATSSDPGESLDAFDVFLIRQDPAGSGGPTWSRVSATDNTAVTLPVGSKHPGSYANGLGIFPIGSDHFPGAVFIPGRSASSPEVTFQFGFTILSMDYTPIPEPGTAALCGMGLLAWLSAARAGTRTKARTGGRDGA